MSMNEVEKSMERPDDLGPGPTIHTGSAKLGQPTPEDPWIRTGGMNCATCMWYVPKQPMILSGLETGRCRRHAPTMSGYPVVFPTDWCGDHKLDENKA